MSDYSWILCYTHFVISTAHGRSSVFAYPIKIFLGIMVKVIRVIAICDAIEISSKRRGRSAQFTWNPKKEKNIDRHDIKMLWKGCLLRKNGVLFKQMNWFVVYRIELHTKVQGTPREVLKKLLAWWQKIVFWCILLKIAISRNNLIMVTHCDVMMFRDFFSLSW